MPGDKLADNGALHMHVLEMLLPNEKAELKACYEIYKKVKLVDFNSYLKYVTCVKGMLGRLRVLEIVFLNFFRRHPSLAGKNSNLSKSPRLGKRCHVDK